jgi:hypothetical protein
MEPDTTPDPTPAPDPAPDQAPDQPRGQAREQGPDGEAVVAVGRTSDQAVDIVHRLIAGPGQVSQADLSILLDTVRRYLHRSSPWLDPAQSEDVAMSALERLLEAARDHQVDPGRNVLGYLLRIARHTAATTARSGYQRHTLLAPANDVGSWQIAGDDNVARHLDARADAQIVRDALASVYRDGDTTSFKVVSYLLDTLQRDGTLPSNRTVAAQLGLSHTGVAKALTRFAQIVTALGGRPT